MADPVDLSVFLAGAAIVSVLWGHAMWYFDERSNALRQWVFFAMNYTRRQAHEVRALLLTAIYIGLGVLAAGGFAGVYHLDVTSLFSFSREQLALSVLGVLGAMSLTNLIVDCICGVTGLGTPRRFAELGEIPWMKGLRKLPPGSAPIVAGLAAVVEEFFFRGILLIVLTDKLQVVPWLAVTIVGALFCLGQFIQLQTGFQVLVIGSGCVVLSLIGGLLIVLTGSVVPALICHGSFVIFFMNLRSQATAGLGNAEVSR